MPANVDRKIDELLKYGYHQCPTQPSNHCTLGNGLAVRLHGGQGVVEAEEPDLMILRQAHGLDQLLGELLHARVGFQETYNRKGGRGGAGISGFLF